MITLANLRWASFFLVTLMLYIALTGAQARPSQLAQKDSPQAQENAQEMVTQAKDLLRSRHYEKAAEALKRALSLQPDSAPAHAHLGMALLRQGRATEALSEAQQAVRLDPSYAFGYVALGSINQEMNRFSEAIEALKQAIHINQDYFDAYAILGSVYGQTRRYEESLEAFTQALRLNANSADVYNGLGIANYRLGRHEEAIAAIKQAVRLNPNFANAYINLGNWYGELGRYEEAADSYTQVIRIAPKFPSGYFNRSLLYMYLGRGAAAADDARTFLSVADWYRERSPYMVILSALGYRQAGRVDEAAKTLDLAAKRCNTSEWPYPVIRYLRQEITAQALLDMASDNDRMTEARAYVGMALAFAGQREEALKHLQWVKENGNKGFIEYRLALAEIGRIEKPAGALKQR
ncbi:MAG TPA: tetratricopeptide repeat protein [Blastocatellia bacterium]|jgi:tetratricopeptide (TPR) repeat protein